MLENEPMKPKDIPILHPKILLIPTNKGGLLCNRGAIEQHILLTQSQALAISLCNGQRKFSNICENISRYYQQPIVRVQRDLMNLFGDLISSRKLLVLPIPVGDLTGIDSDSFMFTPESSDIVRPKELPTITIGLVDGCYLNCVYCLASAPNQVTQKLTTEETVQILRESRELGCRTLVLTGGDPFLHEGLTDIVREAIRLRYSPIQVSTKGIEVEKQNAQELRETGLHWVQFSADSLDKDIYEKIVGRKGAYKRMFRGLYTLLNNDFRILLRAVVSKFNIEHMTDFCRQANDMGVAEVRADMIQLIGNRSTYHLLPSKSQIETFLQEIELAKKELPNMEIRSMVQYVGPPPQCGGGRIKMYIGANGNVTLCDGLAFSGDRFICGNIRYNTLQEIWNSKNTDELRKLRTDDRKCIACSLSELCNAGCRLRSMAETNDPDAPDPICGKISPDRVDEIYLYGMKR